MADVGGGSGVNRKLGNWTKKNQGYRKFVLALALPSAKQCLTRGSQRRQNSRDVHLTHGRKGFVNSGQIMVSIACKNICEAHAKNQKSGDATPVCQAALTLRPKRACAFFSRVSGGRKF